MNRINRLAICACAVVVTALVPVRMSWSADEAASVAQVYLEFDPATGQFVSVPATPENSPNGSVAEDIAAMKHSQTPAQTTTAQPASATPAMTASGDSPGATADGGISPVLIGSIIAIGLLGGIVLMMRKKPA
jgi:cobalamin biosynthesis Mg chelatase CobN